MYKMIRMGIVCSSGGAAFAAAIKILRQVEYTVEAALITDRPCGAELVAEELCIPHIRIPFFSQVQFSKEAANWLYQDKNLDWCCLFFLRLISKELFDAAPCFNIHPSLLPAFPGLGAFEKAATSGMPFFGATAHLVDETLDGGPIVGQAAARMPIPTDINLMSRISHAQKVYLLLSVAERMSRGITIAELVAYEEHKTLSRFFSRPRLVDSSLEDSFTLYLEKEGIHWCR